jgi:hypothetical protein
MGRRKKFIYGETLEEKYQMAFGFPEYNRAEQVLSEIDFDLPKIDWTMIECQIDHEIPLYARKEIDLAFGWEIGFRIRKAAIGSLSGEMPEDEMTESDFLKKSDRIELLAQKLTKEIDELAEIGTRLLVRPKRKDGLTSAEEPDQFYSQISGKTEHPTSECFFDYYAFRKLLDYYASFSAQHGGFQSIVSHRFGQRLDYSWYETLVRRVILAFWPTNFPMTVTIPTDSNPDFTSPIILVLEDLRDQLNELALSMPIFAGMYEEWTYRQHARLVLRLRDEFETADTFWALNTLRKFDSEQSAFGEELF